MKRLLKAGSMHKIIPEAAHGNAKIIHDTPDALDRVRAWRDGQPLDCEKYTRLLIDNKIWMTDAEFEERTNLTACHVMRGDVLIAGLGIGFVLFPLLKNKRVKSITVLEKNADVIALVAPYFPSSVTTLHQDVFEFQPQKKSLDCVYFDIWPNVPNEDNWEEIKTLKRKYRSALRPGGWISAWCEHLAKPR